MIRDDRPFTDEFSDVPRVCRYVLWCRFHEVHWTIQQAHRRDLREKMDRQVDRPLGEILEQNREGP